eukprot:GHVL01012395.1.p1 GENE.GHVL01012395.1~~GHVL01012395.1.p1  ORF type:complete len:139 (-),score=73.77 GHVL01012395.1:441-857(-)
MNEEEIEYSEEEDLDETVTVAVDEEEDFIDETVDNETVNNETVYDETVDDETVGVTVDSETSIEVAEIEEMVETVFETVFEAAIETAIEPVEIFKTLTKEIIEVEASVETSPIKCEEAEWDSCPDPVPEVKIVKKKKK